MKSIALWYKPFAQKPRCRPDKLRVGSPPGPVYGTLSFTGESIPRERFAQNGRVRIGRPRSNRQIQFDRPPSSGNNFVGCVDAIGEQDSTPCVLEWKTTSARNLQESDPSRLLKN